MGYKIRTQTSEEDNQLLNYSFRNAVLLQDPNDVQVIFNLGEPVSKSVVVTGQFDTVDFSSARFVAYLMQDMSTVLFGSTCTFNFYSINPPNWTEALLYTTSGTMQGNGYFFVDVPETTLGLMLDGDPSVMVEAVIDRAGTIYKGRSYLNQLGIYDSYFRLRRQVVIIAATSDETGTNYNG